MNSAAHPKGSQSCQSVTCGGWAARKLRAQWLPMLPSVTPSSQLRQDREKSGQIDDCGQKSGDKRVGFVSPYDAAQRYDNKGDCEGVDEGHEWPADFTKLVIPSHRGNVGCPS
jgi:hypothetical protein